MKHHTRHDPETVLDFWLTECGPEQWYAPDDDLDARIRDRFADMWEAARAGSLEDWRGVSRGALAYVILTDQFPRNMFRGEARAFATDLQARRAAKNAITRGFDLRTDVPERQFFYLPLEHSEYLTDQDRAVRLILARLDAEETLLHARAHRTVIRDFGRFPFRNEALGRTSRPEEREFIARGGYGAVVRALQEKRGEPTGT